MAQDMSENKLQIEYKPIGLKEDTNLKQQPDFCPTIKMETFKSETLDRNKPVIGEDMCEDQPITPLIKIETLMENEEKGSLSYLTFKPEEVNLKSENESRSINNLFEEDLSLKKYFPQKPFGDINKYKCAECNYQTRWKSNLKKHVIRHKDPNEVFMYKCLECNYQTKRKWNVKMHLLRHKDPNEGHMQKCPECNYQAIHKISLKMHLLSHGEPEKIKRYKCLRCDYYTVRKSNLQRHTLSHKDDGEVRLYQCEQCDFRTLYKHSLKAHLLRHNLKEVQVHECTDCDYTTTFKSEIKLHRRLHKEEGRMQEPN